MLASDYKVTDRFGATYKPWSPSKPHSGDDRAMPVGVLVDVGDTAIGLSGNTGQARGPHLHIQKLVDGVYVDPKGSGLADSIAFPARVVETGEKSDTGKFARVLDASNVRWSYFHLSEIKVRAGHVINGKEATVKIEPQTVEQLFKQFEVPFDQKIGKENQIKYYGEKGYTQLYEDLLKYNYNRWKQSQKSAGNVTIVIPKEALKEALK